MVGHIVAHSRRVKRGIKNVRPMKAPTFENAYLDRTRRTSKKKSCRHKNLLIIRQYDTRLQPQNFLRQHAWRQQRVAQRTRSKEVPTATNERRVAAVADRFSAKGFFSMSQRPCCSSHPVVRIVSSSPLVESFGAWRLAHNSLFFLNRAIMVI